MFETTFSIIRIACFMLSKNKERRLALKYDRAGDTKARDNVVFGVVPLWARFVFSDVMKASVEVEGAEKVPSDRAVVFIANHQGNMDIPLLFGYINKPMTFVAKAELGKIPLLSDWMKLLQCTFLERKSPRKSIQAIHDAAEGVKKGQHIRLIIHDPIETAGLSKDELSKIPKEVENIVFAPLTQKESE